MSVAEVKRLYEVNEIYLDRISELNGKLGPRFAERAARADEGNLFVAENFVELKAHGLVAAGVPKELGGGGASHAELSDLLRCTWSAQDCRTGHGGGRGSAFYRSVRLE